jgi:hypothetical protein
LRVIFFPHQSSQQVDLRENRKIRILRKFLEPTEIWTYKIRSYIL